MCELFSGPHMKQENNDQALAGDEQRPGWIGWSIMETQDTYPSGFDLLANHSCKGALAAICRRLRTRRRK
jgi:hypothetical protein